MRVRVTVMCYQHRFCSLTRGVAELVVELVPVVAAVDGVAEDWELGGCEEGRCQNHHGDGSHDITNLVTDWSMVMS